MMASTHLLHTIITFLTFLQAFVFATPIQRRGNDFSCRSTAHPNPVILLHGLFANQFDDVILLEQYLSGLGFCTFSLTYGEYPEFPIIGGLMPIATSATEIANFIREVQIKTGAAKVDLVGHSEGAFQVLYVPKFESGISSIVDKIVAIAPPTRGSNLSGLYNISYILGGFSNAIVKQALDTVGCDACNDLVPGSAAVQRLNSGPIVQPRNQLTVIYTKFDRIVTPPLTTCPVNEAGVRNILVQTQCPFDPVGHVGLVLDTYVWGLVANTLDPKIAKKPCSIGPAI